MSDTPFECVRVTEVYDHPKADKLEIVKILGTQVCVQKGSFCPNDEAIYFPPDMLIPEDIAEELEVKNYLKHSVYPGDLTKSPCRIGAIRLRQIPSVGFLMPFDEGMRERCQGIEWEEGLDLTSMFRGEKYQPPMRWLLSGDMRSDTDYFPRYTSIQHYYRYGTCLEEGRPVRITEKIHGCLISQTRIRMVDGTSKYIRDIQPGEYVAGMFYNVVVPSKVIQVFQNGPVEDWLKIKFTRQHCDRGSSVGTVTCTLNHQFYIDGNYKEAATLKVGDQLSVLSYKTALVSQTIMSITPIKKRQQRWDLETETHNYMPSGVVTHNSNSRVGLVDGELMAGSHQTNRKEFDFREQRSLYWQPMTTPMKEMLLAVHNERIMDAVFDSVVVYGEIFGDKVRRMDYGVNGARGYRVFDMSVGGEYLDWEDVKRYCDYHGIPTVPLLFEGPFSHELVEELMNGPTTVCGEGEIRCSFKGREGIVITPLEEQYAEKLQDRLILKAVSPDYYAAMK